MNSANLLKKRIQELHDRGQSERTHTNIQKLSGLVTLGSGAGIALACGLSYGAIPIAIGVVGYLTRLAIEGKRTGDVRPIPFIESGMTPMMAGMDRNAFSAELADVSRSQDALLSSYAYLTPNEKAEYTLIHLAGKPFAEALDRLPEEDRARAWGLCIDRFQRLYWEYIAARPLDPADLKALGINFTEVIEYALTGDVEGDFSVLSPAAPTSEGTTARPVADLSPPAVTSPTLTPIESLDIVELIIANIFSYAIIGAPGSGKGYVGSHIWRAAQTKLGLKIFAIEPKNDLKERGYWETCEYVYRGTPTDRDATFGELSADEKTAWILDAIATYRQWVRSIGRAPHILVFDEATILLGHALTDRKLFAEIRGLLSHLTSSGNSSGHYIFLLGHIPNLSVYGLSGGEMACLKNIYLYSQKQTDIKNLLAAGNTTYFGSKFGTEKLEEIQEIAARSECGRAFYFGQTNQWYPMQKLPNLCGYDRDSRSFLNAPTDWQRELSILNQRTASIEVPQPDPKRSESVGIADWNNGYQVDDDTLLEVLELLKGKYGNDPINPSEAHRSQTAIRKYYDGKVDNLKAILSRAIQEELAILETDDRGNAAIRLI